MLFIKTAIRKAEWKTFNFIRKRDIDRIDRSNREQQFVIIFSTGENQIKWNKQDEKSNLKSWRNERQSI